MIAAENTRNAHLQKTGEWKFLKKGISRANN